MANEASMSAKKPARTARLRRVERVVFMDWRLIASD
jgi:hypothetical protein